MAAPTQRDLPSSAPPPRSGAYVRRNVLIAALVGVVVAVAAGFLWRWAEAPLFGWDSAAVVYVGTTWLRVGRMDPEATSSHAVHEEPRRAAREAIVLGAAVASLVAVGVVLVSGSRSHGLTRAVDVTLGITSVVASWAVVHVTYTLRYARLYYTGPDGGVQFNQAEKPCYADFAYLSFTIGMTYQVSDTDLTTGEFRRTALRHALLSYLFGTVIVASAINLVAGLSR